MKPLAYLFVAASILLGACTPDTAPTPETSAEDVQSTAVALAWTMAAQTEAAKPTATSTATPVPPTATMPPTATFTPTLEAVLAASSTPETAATQDVCNQPLMSWGGASAPVVVDNRTSEKVQWISIYVSSTARGECGYVPANASSFSVPYGCFYAYAGMTGKKNYNTYGGPFCVNNPDTWHLIIKTSQITLKSP